MARDMSAKHPPPTAGENRMTRSLVRHATLRQLQIFEAFVRLGSFTQAAEELFLTQPTVSMQIKKLTDAVGIPLFEQVGRHVRPTDAGREVYEVAREIFRHLEDLENRLSDFHDLRQGRLRLGAITTAKYFAPEVLGEFCKLYPGIDVSLKISNRERILERLAAQDDDLYIMGQAPSGDYDVEALPFAPNPLVVVASRQHPLVGTGPISMARLAEEPFILREPGSGIRDTTLRAFDAEGLAPSVRMELSSNEAIKHAVVGGLGVSVLSLHTLTLEGIDGHVAVLDVEGFPISRQWYLVYPRRKRLSTLTRTFLDFAMECEAEIRGRMEGMLSTALGEARAQAIVGGQARREAG